MCSPYLTLTASLSYYYVDFLYYNLSMLNLNSILIFSEKPSTLLTFYKKVFQTEPAWSGNEFHGFMAGKGMLIIGPHDKVHGKNKNPERLMFNLETTDVQKEFARLKKAGATEIAAPYHPGEEPTIELATLADPDGNYFQLNTPMK